jgi:hypothetical protein
MANTELRKAQQRRSKERNPERTWAGYATRDARNRAKKKNVPFNITIDYVESILTPKCPVYGTQFQWVGNRKILPISPSLDRIDPAKGYVEGNVVIISSKANNIKSAYKAADLYKVADWLNEIENKGITNGD